MYVQNNAYCCGNALRFSQVDNCIFSAKQKITIPYAISMFYHETNHCPSFLMISDDCLCNTSGNQETVGDMSDLWVYTSCLCSTGPNGLPLESAI